MLEKEIILLDHYLKPPYGGNVGERVNNNLSIREKNMSGKVLNFSLHIIKFNR